MEKKDTDIKYDYVLDRYVPVDKSYTDLVKVRHDVTLIPKPKMSPYEPTDFEKVETT
jgi:hypothetical protein